ncbi:hypothetical protein pb186bvf_011869 [Paramecium bursaria]
MKDQFQHIFFYFTFQPILFILKSIKKQPVVFNSQQLTIKCSQKQYKSFTLVLSVRGLLINNLFNLEFILGVQQNLLEYSQPIQYISPNRGT